MDINIKDGTRVKVLRLYGEDVDFYATVKLLPNIDSYTKLIDCSNSYYEGEYIYLPGLINFGRDKVDYFRLVKGEPSNDNKNTPSLNSEIDTLISALNINNIFIKDMVYESYHTNTLVFKINQEVFININNNLEDYKVTVYYDSLNKEYSYDTWLSAMESIVEYLKSPKEGDKLSKPYDIDTYQIVKDYTRDLYNIINLDTNSIIFTKHVKLSKIRELIEIKEFNLIKDNNGGK